MLAIELMSESVLPVSSEDTGEYALKMMEAFKLSDIPVVDDDGFFGLLSENMVYDFNSPGAKISEFGRLPNIFVYDSQHCFDVIQTLSLSKSTCVPVLNKEYKYLGTITIHEIIPGLSSLFSLHQPGGVLVLNMHSRDYALSEITQIVESNDASIINLYISPYSNNTIDVTIRINKKDLMSIIQTFERFEYVIKNYYTESMEMNDFYEERYKSLMNYLNV
jgi:CBS domain-containing protein